MTTTTITTTFRACDFDAYCAIEEMVFGIFDDIDSPLGFEDVVAFAATLGVEFTEWDWISLGIDYDEM